jgi:hypothetical protein
MTATVKNQFNLDEADLVWYFGRAACRFERSTFGTMIDRLTLLNAGAKPCPVKKCRSGIRWDLTIVIDEWVDSDGRRHRDARWRDSKTGDLYDTNECRRCNGTGSISAPIRGRRPSRTGYRKCQRCKGQGEDEYGETCYTCGGLGYVVRPSAWRTCGAHGEGGATVDDSTLQRSARISRRLDRATETFAGTAVVMCLLYSDDGLRWGQRGKPLLALYPVTEAGRKICRGSVQTEITRGRLEAALTSAEPGTIALMAQALVEATDLERRSREAYRAAA